MKKIAEQIYAFYTEMSGILLRLAKKQLLLRFTLEHTGKKKIAVRILRVVLYG